MGLMTAMVGLGIAGMATSAYGQWQAGNAERKAGEAQQRAAESAARLSEYNAAVAELQAKDALILGEQEAHRFRARTRGLVGEQRAGFAAANVDVGYGSTVDVQADATFLGELDALTIRTNAAREAWGMRVEAEDLRTRAQIMREEGSSALLAGKQRQTGMRLGAGASLLEGTTSLLAQRYGWGRG